MVWSANSFDSGANLKQVVYFVAWTEAKWAKRVRLAREVLLLKLICEPDYGRDCIDIVASLQAIEEAFDEQVRASKVWRLSHACIALR